jgi:bifunctional non-homologous end joining protein LigD
MARATTGGELEVAGRRVRVTTLDRVLFPKPGTTKRELLEYYIRVGPSMLPHLKDRQLHMHRYPEGVEGPRFWQKACPEHRPEWVPVVPVWSTDKNAYIEYCVVNELAALLWAVNLGSIELHTSLHRCHDLHRPTAMAFDLDPGPGAGILHCCEVALRLRELFDAIGVEAYPKTSGSKGLQVFLPLNTDVAYDFTKPASRQIAEILEEQTPEAVVSRMARAARKGRVLVDWGQNTEHKSMVCVYSVRAKERPTVSTPLTWEEVAAAVDDGRPESLVFEMGDVVERVRDRGDLFAPVLSRCQDLEGQLRRTAAVIRGLSS